MAKAIPSDVIIDPDDPRLPINQPGGEGAAVESPSPAQFAEVPQPGPLQGIPSPSEINRELQFGADTEAGLAPRAPQPQPQPQPYQAAEDEEEVPVEELTAQMAPQPSVPVRLMWYGRNFGEHNHAANFGPDGTELQDHHVAISPNVANELGLNLHDWVWVGNQLRQYSDVSAITPNRPTRNSVEVRDEKADGHTTLRKATPAEVASYAQAALPSAQQAVAFTRKPVEQITHADLDQILQPQIEHPRGLIAGEPTQASLEQEKQLEEEGGGGAADATTIDAEEQTNTAALNAGSISGDFPVPPTRGVRYTVDPDGTIKYENGVTANPRTNTVTWQTHGRTFTKMGRYGTVRSDPTIHPWTDKAGNTYNLNDIDENGNPRPMHPAGMIPALTADRAATGDDINAKLAAIDPSLPEDQRKALSEPLQKQREDLALSDLTPDQQNMVKGLAEYRQPVTAYSLRNPQMQYAISRAMILNPNFNAANYDVAKRVMIDYGLQKPGTAGGQIRSINQALGHLALLDKYADEMHNTWNPKWNSVANWLSTNAGKPIVRQYQAAADQVATEVARAFKGAAPDQADINRQLENLSSASSPEQFKAVLRGAMTQLLGTALGTLDAGFQGVTGKELPENRLVFAETKQKLLNMGITDFAGRKLTAEGGGGAAPSPTPAAGAPAYKHGDPITLRDGRVRKVDKILPDGRIQLLPP
jgi:hypothetical protein